MLYFVHVFLYWNIQMLLKYIFWYKLQIKYIGSKKTTAVLDGNAVSLQLHTDSGAQELADDHIVNHWKLKPMEDLTVQYSYVDCCHQELTIIF